jgi:dinuclear metal center YbgI/SA1388 family protein
LGIATASSTVVYPLCKRRSTDPVASTRMQVHDVLDVIDGVFPFADAADRDPVGLQIGGADRPAGRVAVCHEVSGAVVDRVVSDSIDTVISYHPLLFTPTTSLIEGPSAEGRALRLAEAGTSLVIVHTAMDAAHPGTGDALLESLGYVPTASFGADSDDRPPIGRVAALDAPVSGGDVIASVETSLGVSVRSTPLVVDIRAVAVLPGSGSFVIDEAGGICDVLITGDVSHHRAQRAIELGLMVIDPGHAATERPGVRALYDSVRDHVSDVEFIEHDPTPWEA